MGVRIEAIVSFEKQYSVWCNKLSDPIDYQSSNWLICVMCTKHGTNQKNNSNYLPLSLFPKNQIRVWFSHKPNHRGVELIDFKGLYSHTGKKAILHRRYQRKLCWKRKDCWKEKKKKNRRKRRNKYLTKGGKEIYRFRITA